MIQMPVDAAAASTPPTAWPQTAVVEWLEFRVSPSEREEFIQRDDRVWTAALREHPGFLHKSVWTSPQQPESVILAIYWANREAWSSFPADKIGELDRQMQPTTAVLVDSKEFYVRQPPIAPHPRNES